MAWLEIIELRCDGNLNPHLQLLIDNITEIGQKEQIRVYHHGSVETDFSIHLQHKTQEFEQAGSPLGFLLAGNLKEYGLVNHSIWSEITV
jgi:hypothetical protein